MLDRGERPVLLDLAGGSSDVSVDEVGDGPGIILSVVY